MGDAEQGQSPRNAEQRPAPAALERNQRKRRIASGDEQINHAVVDFLQDGFCFRLGNAVVEGGTQIKQNQADAVGQRARKFVGVEIDGCFDGQQHHARNRQHGAD